MARSSLAARSFGLLMILASLALAPLRTCRESALRKNRGARAVRQLRGDQATVLRRNAPAHVVLIRCGHDRYA